MFNNYIVSQQFIDYAVAILFIILLLNLIDRYLPYHNLSDIIIVFLLFYIISRNY